MTDSKVFRLKCEPNNYPWGEVGNDSLAAILGQEASGGLQIKPEEPYAELWMGTHPNNPAHLFADPSQLLSSHIAQYLDLLGEAKKFPARYPNQKEDEFGGKGHVPFLFKILTCKQALPLQIHPNVDLAKKLHQQDPEQFPDTNHKPEIAVCLSDRFLGFAGLRPISQIRALMRATPEIKSLPRRTVDVVEAFMADPRGEDEGSDKPDWDHLRNVFEQFISMEGPEVEKAVSSFVERVSKEEEIAFGAAGEIEQDDKRRLAEATKILNEYNRGDGSIFTSLLLMNLVELKKGEGMYVGADGPHAWLCGEIVELMAASDNVLNVGFTDDKNSTKLVAKAITAQPKPAAEIRLSHQPYHKGTKGNTTVYSVPFEEFSILQIRGAESLQEITGPGIAIVTESNGTTITDGTAGSDAVDAPRGSVWFVGAGTKVDVCGEGEIWMAFYDGDAKSADEVGKQ